MRGKELYEKITNIDDGIIAESSNIAKPKKPIYIKWIAAAACLAVVVSVVSVFNAGPAVDPNLPMLTLTDDAGGGMGFEGYLAYDISDLKNENPWSKDMKLTHLPVIKNKLTYNEMQRIEKPDYDLMESLLKETAKSLGMDENMPVANDIPDEETQKIITEKFTSGGGEVPKGYFDASQLFIEDENYKVSIDTGCTIKVEFITPVKLPNEYNSTNSAAYEDVYRTAEYLKGEYAEFINMENPVINISGGDFNIYSEQSFGIGFYEKSADDTENILNYHFNTAAFYVNEYGELLLARKYYTDLSEVVGEYPIITPDKALSLLKKGNYITTVPQDFEGTEFVKKVELVYRTGNSEKFFMPYYRFYVELPDMKLENGLNSYGAYYVPAVQEQYIENMPIWNGDFNI